MSELILVLGDSHARVFGSSKMRDAFPSHIFDVVSIGGVTVSGLDNPNAKTKGIWTFIHAVESTDAKTIITLLGEVDVGFVIWYRANKYHAPVSQMLRKALNNYQQFLMDIAETDKNVICVSAPLPTLNEKSIGEVSNQRKAISASQEDRTTLTLKFNRKMHEFCNQSGIDYIDLDDESIGDNGVIDDRLLSKVATDHHYNVEAYAEMLAPKLKQVLHA